MAAKQQTKKTVKKVEKPIEFVLNQSIEKGKLSFLGYIKIILGENKDLIETCKNEQSNIDVAKANAIRCIRIQIENKSSKYRTKTTMEQATSFYNDYITNNK